MYTGIRKSKPADWRTRPTHSWNSCTPPSRFRPGVGSSKPVAASGRKPSTSPGKILNPRSSLSIFPGSPSRKPGRRSKSKGCKNVTVEVEDLFNLPYEPGTFDHLFVCFFLEHLHDPLAALLRLKTVLKEGGSITAIEGDHGSYYCHPKSREADLTVRCLVEIQARKQGNALIGRELYPLLAGAGFRSVAVTPRMVYVDGSKPELVEGFTRKTFIAMIEGVREEALSHGLIDENTWDKGYCRSLQIGAGRRHLLLHLFQGCGLEVNEPGHSECGLPGLCPMVFRGTGVSLTCRGEGRTSCMYMTSAMSGGSK